jgi:ribosomal protein S27AE
MKEGFTLGRCPRCGGNIFLENDFDGWHESCLQCGYTRYPPPLAGAVFAGTISRQNEKRL